MQHECVLRRQSIERYSPYMALCIIVINSVCIIDGHRYYGTKREFYEFKILFAVF